MTTPNKYQREIRPGVIVDVYDVLRAWNVTCPALQHLIKKALQPGARGHKTAAEDLNDIVASAIRARDLQASASNEASAEKVKTWKSLAGCLGVRIDKDGLAGLSIGPIFAHNLELPQPSHNPFQPKTFEDAKQ